MKYCSYIFSPSSNNSAINADTTKVKYKVTEILIKSSYEYSNKVSD